MCTRILNEKNMLKKPKKKLCTPYFRRNEVNNINRRSTYCKLSRSQNTETLLSDVVLQ